MSSKHRVVITRLKNVNYWDIDKCELIGSRELPDEFSYMETLWQSRNAQVSENRVAFGENTGRIYIYDLTEEKKTGFNGRMEIENRKGKNIFDSGSGILSHSNYIYSMCSTYDVKPQMERKMLITASADKNVCVWKMSEEKGIELVKKFDGTHEDWIMDVCFIDERCSTFCSSGWDGKIIEYDLEKCVRKGDFRKKDRINIHNIAFNKKRNLIFGSTSAKYIEIYDGRERKFIRRKEFSCNDARNFNTLLSDAEEDSLYCCTFGGWVGKMDLRKNLTGKEIVWGRKVHQKFLTTLLPHYDEEFLVSAAEDGFVRVIDRSSGKKMKEFKEPQRLYGILLIRDNRLSESLKIALKDLNERVEYIYGEEDFDALDFSLKMGNSKIEVMKLLLFGF